MADPNLRQVSETTDACPRCDMIFTMLEASESGERVQHIEMVERGKGQWFLWHRVTSIRSPYRTHAEAFRNTLPQVEDTFLIDIFSVY